MISAPGWVTAGDANVGGHLSGTGAGGHPRWGPGHQWGAQRVLASHLPGLPAAVTLRLAKPELEWDCWFFSCSHLELLFGLLKVTARVPAAGPEVRRLGPFAGTQNSRAGVLLGVRGPGPSGGPRGKRWGWWHGCLALGSRGLWSPLLTPLPYQKPCPWPRSFLLTGAS